MSAPVRTALFALALATSTVRPTAAQQQPTKVTPELPANGASVAVRPKFVLRTDAADVAKLRFRIELSKDGFETVSHTFDQLKDANGWAYIQIDTEPQGAVYFPQKKLEGGDYSWRVSSWDGLSWQTWRGVYRVTIDDVPPAEVEGVRMLRDRDKGCMHVTWDAVSTDQKGNPERVARYHVFRYWERSGVPPLGPFEAGTSTTTQFDDCDPATQRRPLVFYRVEAEDEAGNIFGRRTW